jgi:hypothetical protein
VVGFVGRRPYNGLAKEREGAPSPLPRCFRLFLIILASFSAAVLTLATAEAEGLTGFVMTPVECF